MSKNFKVCLPDSIGEKYGRETKQNTTSIFDPVLTELIYRWFTPLNGRILDPFAGGSVRGIVAAYLGKSYTGFELRKEQVDANYLQWEQLPNKKTLSIEPLPDNLMDLTPVKLGIPCRAHTPEGELSSEITLAQVAGAEIIQHKAGYNNVIVARAREDARSLGWTEIPFGMECQEAVNQTMRQVKNIPDTVKRIVVPVGSGMSLAGVLHGLIKFNKNIPVIGVKVGADPLERLNKYAPKNWEKMVTLVDSGVDYHDAAKDTILGHINLDPIYEAKCLPFLKSGDLLWVVGIRMSEINTGKLAQDPVWINDDSRNILSYKDKLDKFDLLFTCPPYADLEVYSDDPLDLSTLKYPDFKAAYFDIIKKSCELLSDDSFACIVVGEVRDKKNANGSYYNFVGDTIQAFIEAGLSYYNEMILVTCVGTLPIRAGKSFKATRKIGKTHQNILVFLKGDITKAVKKLGDVDVERFLEGLVDNADDEFEQGAT